VVQKKMFGGLAFMVRSPVSVGINGNELMVRVGPDQYLAALERPFARETDFTGRALKGIACASEIVSVGLIDPDIKKRAP